LTIIKSCLYESSTNFFIFILLILKKFWHFESENFNYAFLCHLSFYGSHIYYVLQYNEGTKFSHKLRHSNWHNFLNINHRLQSCWNTMYLKKIVTYLYSEISDILRLWYSHIVTIIIIYGLFRSWHNYLKSKTSNSFGKFEV